jgi:hypothetical protein
MKENKPAWIGETRSQSGVIHKCIDYYEGHVPKDKFPKDSKVIYGNGLTGHETEVHTQSITPVVTITVYEGEKPTR